MRTRPKNPAALASICLAVVYLSALTSDARSEVIRFEITERTPFAEGHSFGTVGPYERIVGRVYYAVDPNLRQNSKIVDLQYAPANSQGLVEFSSDLFILAPRDLDKGNRALLYDVNNRGNKLALRFFNDAVGSNDAADAGHGFLMRHGFTIVWSGWNGELLPGDGKLQLRAPVATTKGVSITGLVRCEMCPDRESNRLPISRDGQGSYRPSSAGLANASLSWRRTPSSSRVLIPREQFHIHVIDGDQSHPSQLAKIELELPAGFRKGYLYELIYEARDPIVHGTCFASVRDLIAALRGTTSGHPLKINNESAIQYAYAFGVSQSGRFLREFLHSGFNEDESGKRVFDGLIPHVAGGGLGSFNHRFAQPTAFSMQHDFHDWPVDRFPFSYESQLDPIQLVSQGILDEANNRKVSPKVVHTQSSTEYWSRSGSLVHTDPAGQRDGTPPADLRIFAFGGTQHGPASYPPAAGIGQTLPNPADYRPFLRSLLLALDSWCREGVEPPPSVYPKVSDNTLAKYHDTGFPAIPGLRYPELIHQPALYDYGSRWDRERIIDQQPPKSIATYAVLVPRCDADGNELGCLLPPEVAVPTATYSGWALRSASAGAEDELVGLSGSYIPFPRTKLDKQQLGDPRLSLEERYGTPERYLEKLRAECERLLAARYLLAEDVDRIVERERQRWPDRGVSFEASP